MRKQLHDDVSYLCCLSFWENLTPAAAAAGMCEVKKHEEGEGIYQNKGASSSRNSWWQSLIFAHALLDFELLHVV